MAHVDIYISVAGAGAKDGTSSANAYDDTNANWQTISSAWNGDTTLLIAAGTYTSFSASVVLSGTDGSHTTKNIVKSVDASTWADGDYEAILNMQGSYRWETTTLDHFIFKGITFTNGSGGFYASTMTHTRWENCKFNSNSFGIWLTTNLYNVFENCQINNNTGDGIYSAEGAVFNNCQISGNGDEGLRKHTSNANLIFKRCEIADNTNDGLGIGSEGCSVFDCVIDDNGGDGIYSDTSTVAISGNKITNNGGYGIQMATSSPIDMNRNYFYNNTSGEIDNGGLYDMSRNSTSMSGDYYTNAAGGDFSSTDSDESVNIANTVGNDYTIYESVFGIEGGAGGGVLFNNGMNGGLNG